MRFSECFDFSYIQQVRYDERNKGRSYRYNNMGIGYARFKIFVMRRSEVEKISVFDEISSEIFSFLSKKQTKSCNNQAQWLLVNQTLNVVNKNVWFLQGYLVGKN